MLNKTNNLLIFSVFVVFIVKFLFAYLPSFGADMGTWFGWAYRLVEVGMSEFYTDSVWTQYTPGYLYFLWLVGKLGVVSEMIIKVPVIFADIWVGVLIWSLVKKVNPKWAIISFLLYVLNPVVIFDGSVWGQIDGLLTLFLFGSAYLLIERKALGLSVLLWSIAFLIKPQAVAVLPAIFLSASVKKFSFREVLVAGILGIATVFVGAFPFFRDNPILGLPQWIIKMGEHYSYTSVFAFNIWSWVGFWESDSTLFGGLSLAVWGSFLLLASVFFALLAFRKRLTQKHNHYLLFAVLSLAFFVFPTRVHERYIFPFFAFLLAAAFTAKSRNLVYIYIVTTVGSFLNLYYPYVYYYPAQLKVEFLYKLSENFAKLVGFVFFVSYFALIFWEKLPKQWISFPINRLIGKNINYHATMKFNFPKLNLSKRTTKLFLGSILFFSFITRVYSLEIPPTEYFDEVYHAFTAKVILHNDPKAWEWWNTPPEGFAYEWTHPPLAKLGMFLGMKVFGENSFGYRIPQAALGIASVYLVYLLARHLFKDEAIGLLSAAAFSLDGLVLVMNRIGMNDSYLLFFSLLTIYLFSKQKDLPAALSFGLAISSKWSAIWAIPILGILFLQRLSLKGKPLKITKTFLCFLLLPFTIYLLTYIPMFLTGHNLSVWWEMQKQMWWYHTGLDATHPYTSQWWSWPFLVRPIYLYTSDEVSGMVSRIYAFGNPLVFWFGLTSVVIGFIYGFIQKNKKLGLVVFSYLIFFVPWALSPRIMFLYHYLPSIPFMCIAIGYVLRRNPGFIKPFLVSGLVLFIYFFPHWAGLSVPLWLDASYYWVNTWR